jgi:chromosomal replication initiation ATPase DnaA
LSGKKPDKEIPALQELHAKIYIQDIVCSSGQFFGSEPALSRNVKLFLCRKYTSERLKDIGAYFGIGESGVAHANRRMTRKIANDKNLKGRVKKIETKLNSSRMKT